MADRCRTEGHCHRCCESGAPIHHRHCEQSLDRSMQPQAYYQLPVKPGSRFSALHQIPVTPVGALSKHPTGPTSAVLGSRPSFPPELMSRTRLRPWTVLLPLELLLLPAHRILSTVALSTAPTGSSVLAGSSFHALALLLQLRCVKGSTHCPSLPLPPCCCLHHTHRRP